MKHRGFISDKTVCSNSPFIVYSHTNGIVAEPPTLEEAQRIWEMEISRCAERGRESDALIFQWLQGHWFLCGDMYDLADVGASAARWKP